MSIIGTGVYCNTKINGGGEQSAQWIAGRLNAPLISLNNGQWKDAVAKKQIWYMNDSIYMLLREQRFKEIIDQADDVYIILNFTMGGCQNQGWLKEKVRKFLFLNNQKKEEFQSKCIDELRDISKVALPPPVEIDEFLGIEREQSEQIVIGRHSRISLKYPKEPEKMYEKLAEKLPDAIFYFQIAHPRIVKAFQNDLRFKFFKWNEMPVPEFLGEIGIYLSIINPNTKDQGPRTLIEAMAAGLPCVVENRDGMKERMINGNTGFLVNNEDEAVDKTIMLFKDRAMRLTMGDNARNVAKQFNPQKWIRELNG